LAVYFIWGSTYYAIEIAVETLPPFLMTGGRLLFASILVFAFLRTRGKIALTRLEWRNTLLIGALMFGGGMGGVTFAEQWVTSGLAALMVASMPLWMALLATFLERRPTRLELSGLAVGFAGVIILNIGGDLWAEPAGAIALLLAPFLWANGSMISRRVTMPKGFRGVAPMLLGGSIVMFLAGLVSGESVQSAPEFKASLALLYLTLFGSIIGFGSYYFLLGNTSPVLASSYAYVNPIIAVLLGWMLAGDALTGQTFVAGLFILTAVVIITISRSQPKEVPDTRLTKGGPA
jgi:drug/metabolite transporter (DMT)-like permease